MKEKPKITVLMAAFNAEKFLREAIDSVLEQTVENFEFFIFEDCSTDSTRQILESYDDPRIKVYFNEMNQGLTKNLIRGMDLAQGEYVARMDADDVCLPYRFERQLEYFTEHLDVSVLGSAVTFFDGKGNEFVGYQPQGHEEIKVALLLGFTMLHPSVMMRKADMDRYGLNYDPEFVVSQDHDLWTRSIRKLRFANHSEPLLKMREHPAKIGNTRKSTQKDLSSGVRQKQLDELEVEYTRKELEVFNTLASKGQFSVLGELLNCESILLKILEVNRRPDFYVQSLLESAIANVFYELCSSLLVQRSTLGCYYRKSKLRHLKQISLRDTVVMSLRAVNCLIFKMRQID